MNVLLLSLPALLAMPVLAEVQVNEIPERLQQTATVVRLANGHAKPLGAIVEIERSLPRFKQGTHGLLATTTNLMKRRISPGATRELRNAWAVIKRRLAGWQDIVRQRSGSLHQDLAALDGESKAWRATLEAAAAEQLPRDLRSEIRRGMDSIAAARQAVLSRRNMILTLQGELSRLAIDLDEMDERLGEALNEGRGRLLRIDAPPLWRSDGRAVEENAVPPFKVESVVFGMPFTPGC